MIKGNKKCQCGKEILNHRIKWCSDKCEAKFNYLKRKLEKTQKI